MGTTTDACRLCLGATQPVFSQRVLGRYDAVYFKCGQCDLIQTENPYWLEEAYTAAICSTDTGAIRRNELTCQLTRVLANALGVKANDPCLDYGGGHGVFVRMMRDRGYDFHLQDKYAVNCFARGFECEAGQRSKLVTAFEIFEHLVGVREETDEIFARRPDFLLIGTQLHRDDGQDWWYYTPHTGQHVAFYSARTMAYLAHRHGYRCVSSRAYTLMIKDEVSLPGARRELARMIIRKSRGDRNCALVRGLDCVLPALSSRTGADSERMRRAA